MNVLLLHGQPGGAHDWDAVRAAIGSRAATFAIDRPGYDRVSAPGGVAHSAAAAVAWMDSQGIEQATVVGLSFGGGVAAWLAAQYPQRVAALVLISAAANGEALQPSDRLLAAPVVGRVVSTALLAGIGVLLKAGVLQRNLEARYGLPAGYLGVAARELRTRAALNAFVVEQRALLIELPQLESLLPSITAPTTVVVGTQDTVVRPQSGRQVAAAIPDAQLVEIAGGRHTLNVTHPERIGEIVLAAAIGAEQERAGGVRGPAAGDVDGGARSDDRLDRAADDRR